MTLIALKDLPHRVKAGATFEANAIIGQILIAAGAAHEVVGTSESKARRPYRRRDLRTPEDYPTTELTADE